MFWAEELMHVGTAEDGVVIISLTSRDGQPHEIAMPADQATALAASLVATLAATPPGTVRQIQTRYIQADLRMGQGPGTRPALVARFGPLQLTLPLSDAQRSALKQSLDEH
jgi:hypothetical protein